MNINNCKAEFVHINIDQFLKPQNQIDCKIINVVQSFFKDNKYIVQVYVNKTIVIRISKRYAQFESLHNLILSKYKDIELGNLPSKFQLFDKEKKRKKYFEKMLNLIVKHNSTNQITYQNHPQEANEKRLLSILYFFLTSSLENDKKSTNNHHKNSEILHNHQHSHLETKSQNYQMESKLQNDFHPENNSYEQLPKRQRSKSDEIHTTTFDKIEKSQENQFEVKFGKDPTWKKRYIQIKNSVLYLYINKHDRHHKTQLELYRIKVEFLKRNMNLIDHFCQKMEFDFNRTFNQNKHILSIYHEYDCDKILIRRPQIESPEKSQQSLQKLKQAIVQASQTSPVYPDFDGVFNPIGKIYICVHKISLRDEKMKNFEGIKVRIKTGVTTYETKAISQGGEIAINQGFLIPISNTFQSVKFEYLSLKKKGWLDDSDQGDVLGSFTFNMVQFFMKRHRHLIKNLVVRMDDVDGKKDLAKSTKLQVSIENLSDFSSIYSSSSFNENDGVPLKPIQGFDDIDQLSLTIDRFLRIIGEVCLFIQSFWRNVYSFKYPLMSFFFFILVLFNSTFLSIDQILRQSIFVVFLAIVYQHAVIKLFVGSFLQNYVFKHIHPQFKTPLILSTDEVNYLKWSHAMKYISEDYEYVDGKLQKKDSDKRTVFQFLVHGRVFTIIEEEQTIFEKFKGAKKVIDSVRKIITTLTFTLQKLINLLTWADPRKTLFIATLVLLMTGVASSILIRVGVSIFCINRLRKGMNFYGYRHYSRNRKFAVYCLRYILQKHFPEIIGDKTINKFMSFTELNQFMSNLVFPIHTESAQKKLKEKMKEIMGVYFEAESFYPKALSLNYLKFVHILDAVESCESRLKLKLVVGEESISNEFQQLKDETTDIPVLDTWLEESFKNFVLNTPSQLYFIFHREKLHKIEQTENKDLKLTKTTVSQFTTKKINKENQIPTLFIQESKLIEIAKEQNKKLKQQQNHKVTQQKQLKQKICLQKQNSQ